MGGKNNGKLVKVLQKHIDAGSSFCLGCPVALAVRESLGIDDNNKNDFIIASYTNITRKDDEKTVKIYKTPRSAERFMKLFDKCVPVKPFNFILREYTK